MSQDDQDRRFLKLAIDLGRHGLGTTWPNPSVGCVIVRDGIIVGRGHTQPGGRPHAEPMALAQAGDLAAGATAYVSLEPCTHHGKAPPCVDALINANVARVVFAATDVDPRVAGKSRAILEAKGIAVTGPLDQAAGQLANAGFFHRVSLGRPWVTLKLANSIDGRIATATGDSQWITGPQARRLVHAQRRNHDAVMVGGGTARTDDPSLDVRGLGQGPQPVRVVLSSGLDLPLNSKLAATAKDVPVWICHSARASRDLVSAWHGVGAEMIEVNQAPTGGLDGKSCLQALGAKGLTRVYCEGGGQLAASLLKAGCVDEILRFGAGVAIGGDGRAGLGDMGIIKLATARRFELVDLRRVGPDLMETWRPIAPG